MWVLATLVLVQAYQSTLITYVIAPVTTPLINSVYDLAENTNINFVVRRGGTLEYLFKVNLLACILTVCWCRWCTGHSLIDFSDFSPDRALTKRSIEKFRPESTLLLDAS